MLGPNQRTILFCIFCVAVTALLGLEGYLAWSMIEHGITGGKAATSILTTGLLAGCGVIFKQLLDINFVKREILPMTRLHQFATERNGIIEDARRSQQDIYETRRALVTWTLRFAEETLKGWIHGSHLELCVFIDSEMPLQFAYFDSNKHSVSRSMSMRASNPKFYLEKGYEVTKLLLNPSSQPQIINDTRDPKLGYTFTTKGQRKQLRSSILLCLDLTNPCALVISSNEKKAFPESDLKLQSFVRYIGELVRADLLDDSFLNQFRELNPNLFRIL